MPPYLQLKCHFLREIHPSEGVILLSEQKPLPLRGAAFLHVIPLLDGKHTYRDILHKLRELVPLAEILYVIGFLQSRGYLVDTISSASISEPVTLWQTLGVEPRDADRRLHDAAVSIATCGAFDSAPFRTTLASFGVQVEETGQLSLVFTDDYLHYELDTFNQEALQQNRPWMIVRPVSMQLWIGPLFLPGETGCWTCLAHRLRGLQDDEISIQKTVDKEDLLVRCPKTSSAIQTACRIAAWELAKWIIRGENKTIEGQVLSLDLHSFSIGYHQLVKRPQCLRCGSPILVATTQSQPISLKSYRKGFVTDGGHRIFPPETTVRELAHHISPITGIVSDLKPNGVQEDQHLVAPSYIAAHNFHQPAWQHSPTLDSLAVQARQVSGGKGKDKTQAKASALCEAIEHYSAIFQGDEARLQARLKDLRSTAIHPNSCMLFSEHQFATYHRKNITDSRVNLIPVPFNEDQEIEWSPAWSLTYGERRWLPTAYCYYGYSQKYNANFAFADSNGCAAGCSMEEAILQGFLELVERDCVALWWYNRLKKPAVDLTSFPNSYFQELQEYYNTLQRRLWVLDITNDLGIPTFAAISHRFDNAVENIICGFGSHFEASLAILRAITEVNQSLPAFSSSTASKDIVYSNFNQTILNWLETATLKNQPYLLPDKSLPAKTYADYSSWLSEDLCMDVMACVKIAEARGLETIVVDQTRPDTGLYVVKVVVPGLRHFWARFAPGRLYDVPVQMGWLTAPLTENQLNSQHIFF